VRRKCRECPRVLGSPWGHETRTVSGGGQRSGRSTEAATAARGEAAGDKPPPNHVNCRRCPALDAVGVNHGNRDTRRTRTYATAHAATGDGE